MSRFPATTTARRPAHTRRIVCSGYIRDDGLYDIEARMTDTKGYDSRLLLKDLPAGDALHDMWFTITVDAGLVIRSAFARTDASPTPYCAQINGEYAKLVGLRIAGGFTKEVKARVGGTRGCTHLTELLGPMATTAFQTVMGPRSIAQAGAAAHGNDGLPLLDTCHAWRAGGEVAGFARQRAQACRATDTPVVNESNAT